MTDDLTREADIRARADAATEGPWELDQVPETGECAVFGGTSRWHPEGHSMVCANAHYSDAEFIAHSREDIDYLLAENQRLRQDRDRLEANEPPCDGGCNYLEGPEEACSLHGRPTAEVWEIVNKVGAENQRLRDQRDAALALDYDAYYEADQYAAAVRAALTGELAARERKERGNK